MAMENVLANPYVGAVEPMEVIVDQKEFAAAVARVKLATYKQNMMPVLTNLKLETFTNQLVLSSTDLTVSMVAVIPADVRRVGSVCLQASALAAMIPAESGELQVIVSKEFTAKMRSPMGEFELIGMPGDDFPKLPTLKADAKPIIELASVSVLTNLIKKAFRFMSPDETCPHMCAMLIDQSDGMLHTVAVDGHRLGKAWMENAGTDVSLLIPRKAVEIMMKFATTKGKLEIYQQGSSAFFLFGNGDLFAVKLVDAAFPVYQQVFPSSHDRSIVANRKVMLAAVKHASTVCSDLMSGCRFSFVDDKMVIDSENSDLGTIKIGIPVETCGPMKDFKIGFNSRYLVNALEAVTDEKVTFEFSGELDLAVMRAPGFACVIMPMRI